MKITSRNGESFQGVDCESGDCNNGSLAQKKKMLLAFLRSQNESGKEEGRGGDWEGGSAHLDVDEPLRGSQEDEDGVDSHEKRNRSINRSKRKDIDPYAYSGGFGKRTPKRVVAEKQEQQSTMADKHKNGIEDETYDDQDAKIPYYSKFSSVAQRYGESKVRALQSKVGMNEKRVDPFSFSSGVGKRVDDVRFDSRYDDDNEGDDDYDTIGQPFGGLRRLRSEGNSRMEPSLNFIKDTEKRPKQVDSYGFANGIGKRWRGYTDGIKDESNDLEQNDPSEKDTDEYGHHLNSILLKRVDPYGFANGMGKRGEGQNVDDYEVLTKVFQQNGSANDRGKENGVNGGNAGNLDSKSVFSKRVDPFSFSNGMGKRLDSSTLFFRNAVKDGELNDNALPKRVDPYKFLGSFGKRVRDGHGLIHGRKRKDSYYGYLGGMGKRTLGHHFPRKIQVGSTKISKPLQNDIGKREFFPSMRGGNRRSGQLCSNSLYRKCLLDAFLASQFVSNKDIDRGKGQDS